MDSSFGAAQREVQETRPSDAGAPRKRRSPSCHRTEEKSCTDTHPPEMRKRRMSDGAGGVRKETRGESDNEAETDDFRPTHLVPQRVSLDEGARVSLLFSSPQINPSIQEIVGAVKDEDSGKYMYRLVIDFDCNEEFNVEYAELKKWIGRAVKVLHLQVLSRRDDAEELEFGRESTSRVVVTSRMRQCAVAHGSTAQPAWASVRGWHVHFVDLVILHPNYSDYNVLRVVKSRLRQAMMPSTPPPRRPGSDVVDSAIDWNAGSRQWLVYGSKKDAGQPDAYKVYSVCHFGRYSGDLCSEEMFFGDPKADLPANVVRFRSLLSMHRQPVGDESDEHGCAEVVYDATDADHSVNRLQPALPNRPTATAVFRSRMTRVMAAAARPTSRRASSRARSSSPSVPPMSPALSVDVINSQQQLFEEEDEGGDVVGGNEPDRAPPPSPAPSTAWDSQDRPPPSPAPSTTWDSQDRPPPSPAPSAVSVASRMTTTSRTSARPDTASGVQTLASAMFPPVPGTVVNGVDECIKLASAWPGTIVCADKEMSRIRRDVFMLAVDILTTKYRYAVDYDLWFGRLTPLIASNMRYPDGLVYFMHLCALRGENSMRDNPKLHYDRCVKYLWCTSTDGSPHKIYRLHTQEPFRLTAEEKLTAKWIDVTLSEKCRNFYPVVVEYVLDLIKKGSAQAVFNTGTMTYEIVVYNPERGVYQRENMMRLVEGLVGVVHKMCIHRMSSSTPGGPLQAMFQFFRDLNFFLQRPHKMEKIDLQNTDKRLDNMTTGDKHLVFCNGQTYYTYEGVFKPWDSSQVCTMRSELDPNHGVGETYTVVTAKIMPCRGGLEYRRTHARKMVFAAHKTFLTHETHRVAYEHVYGIVTREVIAEMLAEKNTKTATTRKGSACAKKDGGEEEEGEEKESEEEDDEEEEEEEEEDDDDGGEEEWDNLSLCEQEEIMNEFENESEHADGTIADFEYRVKERAVIRMLTDTPNSYRDMFLDNTRFSSMVYSDELDDGGPVLFEKLEMTWEEVVIKKLDEVFGDHETTKLFLRFIAIGLSGEHLGRYVFYMHGPAMNGKSYVLNMISNLFGRDNPMVKTLESDYFNGKRQYMDAQFRMDGSAEIRFLKINEMPILDMTPGGKVLVKQFTGGDVMTGRGPHALLNREYKNNAKILTASNDIPYFNEGEKAEISRFWLVPALTLFRKSIAGVRNHFMLTLAEDLCRHEIFDAPYPTMYIDYVKKFNLMANTFFQTDDKNTIVTAPMFQPEKVPIFGFNGNPQVAEFRAMPYMRIMLGDANLMSNESMLLQSAALMRLLTREVIPEMLNEARATGDPNAHKTRLDDDVTAYIQRMRQPFASYKDPFKIVLRMSAVHVPDPNRCVAVERLRNVMKQQFEVFRGGHLSRLYGTSGSGSGGGGRPEGTTLIQLTAAVLDDFDKFVGALKGVGLVPQGNYESSRAGGGGYSEEHDPDALILRRIMIITDYQDLLYERGANPVTFLARDRDLRFYQVDGDPKAVAEYDNERVFFNRDGRAASGDVGKQANEMLQKYTNTKIELETTRAMVKMLVQKKKIKTRHRGESISATLEKCKKRIHYLKRVLSDLAMRSGNKS